MSAGQSAGLRYYERQLTRAKRLLGNGRTSASQLDDAAPKLGLSDYRGTWPADKCPELPEGSSVVLNLDSTGQPGTHWIALYAAPRLILCYDSFGRRVKGLARPFARLPLRGRDLVDAEEDAEQHIVEENCGQRCLAWLMTAQNKGPAAALGI